MKLLKKKCLFALYCGQNDRDFSYLSYDYLYFRTSEYCRGSVRSAVNELVKGGLADKLRRNRRSRFKLTASGREFLLKNLSRLSREAGWDRRWRLVIITGRFGAGLRPLQRRLFALNYRRLSRGVYLSPFAAAESTRETLARYRWLNQAAVIESRRILGLDDQQLARSVWLLEEIAAKYDQFITLAQRLLSSSRRNLVLLQQAKFGFKAVFDAYFILLCLDPALPKVLLPPEWPGGPAAELFDRLNQLAKTAKI